MLILLTVQTMTSKGDFQSDVELNCGGYLACIVFTEYWLDLSSNTRPFA